MYLKKYLLFLCLCALTTMQAQAQTINSAYVKALYKKYPTQKTDFCASCKLWINPYYKSIADTAAHMPLLTYYVYTKAHRLQQETLDLPRSGVYAGWQSALGQPGETPVYREANRIINQPYKDGEMQKGHCQAWILLAYSEDAAILSNTYTFNSAMEYRGQNLGTEIESEELCRELTGFGNGPVITDSVKIWCGTFGKQGTFKKGKVTNTVPSHYYKIIKYRDHTTGQVVTLCYWMPNQPTEKRELLSERKVDTAFLIGKLGFDPQKVFLE